jgi:hypothetical protein
MEGIPIPNPNHFDIPGATGGPISIVNNKLLTQSDFLTSAFPAEYSNGVSGVFDLNLRNGNNRKRQYVADIGLMGFEVGAEGPFSKDGKASYIVNFRQSLLGLVDEFLWVEALPHYRDLSFKMNFPLKKGRISLFGFGGSSRIRGVIDDSASTTPMYKHQMADESGAKTGIMGIKHVHFLGDKTRLISDLSVATSRPYNRLDSMVNDAVTRTIENNRFREDRFQFSTRISSKLNAKNSIHAGITIENNAVEYRFHDEHIIYPATGGDSLVMLPPKVFHDNNLILLRGFTEWKHRFTNALSLYAGLNYMHFFMNNSLVLEPRANIRWKFTEKQAVSFGYGLHSQLHPFFHYLIRTYTSEDPWERENYLETNRDLDFTKSHHMAFGYDFSISDDLRFKAEVYRQELFEVPVERRASHFSLINIGAGLIDPRVDSLVNEGSGRNKGIEFTLEKFLSNRYYFLLTASLLDSKYKGSDGILRNSAFNSNYNFNVLVGYELPVRDNSAFDFNIRFVAAGGRRFIPLDKERTIQQKEAVYRYDQAYEPRLADYYRLDTRAGYKHNGPKVRHEIGMDITNVTNRPNEWEKRYDEHSNRIEMIYQQGIFFYVFYRINF